jgi:hypothetical protein
LVAVLDVIHNSPLALSTRGAAVGGAVIDVKKKKIRID